MAVHGHHVDEVDGRYNRNPSVFPTLTPLGNTILKWSIAGAPAKAVIALAYIFVGICKFGPVRKP